MKSLSCLVLLGVLAPVAYSQSVLYTFDGDSVRDNFGYSVSGAGDVNGDGYADVIVGAPGDGSHHTTTAGLARVFSGLDGSVLYTFLGSGQDSKFGQSVSGAGDVNGDGYADVIVGAWGANNHGKDSGSARVLSGRNGSVRYTLFGDSKDDRFGTSVSGAGDVNGDGFADVIVGAPGDDNNGASSGTVSVFSGIDRSLLYFFDGDSAGDWFGRSVSGAGDVNGDGYADMIVGSPFADNNGSWSGSAKVLSGMDGSILYTFDGDSVGDRFGDSVSGAGDVNGDGFDDLIVGAAYDDNNGSNSGSARVFSGQNGSILYTFDGNSVEDYFGLSVSGAGDVNGDGFDDLIVGASGEDNNGQWSGSVRLLSGLDGSVLYTIDGDPGDRLGFSVSGAGDVDGDGFADLIGGAIWDDPSGTGSGGARVFSGCDVLGTNYCGPANLNSTGQSAVITACGSDLADGGYFMLHADDLPPGKFGYFLASETQAFVPFAGGSQGNLCLGGQIARFAKQIQSSGPSGKLTIRVDLTSIPPNPPHTVVGGETWNFQGWFRDVGNTSNFTDGVAVLFQ